MAVPSGWATAHDYDWVSDWAGLGYCVTLVEHLSPDVALRRIVTDPRTAMSTAEIVRQWVAEGVYPEPRSSIEAATLGDWTVVVEEGFLASIPSVMRRLAAGSRALAMYRNVNAVMSLVWAVDGAIVRWFDPLLVDDRFGEPQAEEAGLPFGEPDLAEAAMFACGERLTSVRLTEAFLDDRLAWVAVGHDWMASSQHESYD